MMVRNFGLLRTLKLGSAVLTTSYREAAVPTVRYISTGQTVDAFKNRRGGSDAPQWGKISVAAGLTTSLVVGFYCFRETDPAFCNDNVTHDREKSEDVRRTPLEDTDAAKSDINPLWRSKQSRPFEKKYEETAIFSGSSNKTLAVDIADHLGTKLGVLDMIYFSGSDEI